MNITDEERREAVAMSSFRVKFSQVDRGPNIYSAYIYIDNSHFGYIVQRRGGPYEAFTAKNRKVGEADSLSVLRETVIAYYADSERLELPPAS